MKYERINNSATIARYRVTLETDADKRLSPDQIADIIEPHNYGASVFGYTQTGAMILNIRID